MNFSLPLNVLYCQQIIKLAVGTMVVSLHTLLKDVLRNLSTETAAWVYLKRQSKEPKRCLIQLTVSKRN